MQRLASPSPYVELLEPVDPPPLLLLADHGHHLVPPELGDLGIGAAELGRHIGHDIGILELTRTLARILRAPAIIDHCSRLVIDPNRRPFAPTSIPPVSDGTIVPANRGIHYVEAQRRIRDYFLPYHRCIARRLARFGRAGQIPVVVALHSFTPRMNGQDRPWQIGVLWRDDRRLAGPVLEALRARGDLVVGENQPYSGQDEFGFTVEFHCQRTRLPHVMLEIRQDEIGTPAGARAYAEIVAQALRPPLAEPGLYTRYTGERSVRSGIRAPWRDGISL